MKYTPNSQIVIIKLYLLKFPNKVLLRKPWLNISQLCLVFDLNKVL